MPAGRERPKASTNQINAKCEMRYRPGLCEEADRLVDTQSPPRSTDSLRFPTDGTVVPNLIIRAAIPLACALRDVTFIMESSLTVCTLINVFG